MNEEKQPLGKVAFDAAYDQWADGLIGSPTVQWAELDDPAQTGWGIIAGAVAAEVANPTAEDYDHAAEEIARRSEPAQEPVLAVVDLHRWYAVITQPDGTSKVIGHTDNGLGCYDSVDAWERANS